MLNGNVPVMESQQIQNPILRPSQTDHYNRILECLQRFYFYIDGSEPGTGKTHVTCKIARDSGLTMVVLCPSTAKVTWIDAFRDYSMAYWNLPVTGGIITYETFRSTKVVSQNMVCYLELMLEELRCSFQLRFWLSWFRLELFS